jgi:uncharacterized protein YunC (DUF1805 family)
MRLDFFMTLRGREVYVDCGSVVAAEPDVGIASAYADEFTVKDLESGEVLELTEAEEQAVVERSAEAMQDRYEHEHILDSVLSGGSAT